MARGEKAPRAVVLCFAVAVLGAAGFAVSYALNLGTQFLGSTIGGAFLAVALGLALWSRRIEQAEPEYVEERELRPSPRSDWSAFEQALTTQPVPRVKVLWSMLGLALGSIGAAALFPLRSLWSRHDISPDQRLSNTSWRRGRALVTEEGFRIRPTDLDYGGVIAAFPEDDDLKNVDATVMLVRLRPHEILLPPRRRGWVVDGVIAYSRLCTHAGCPVGLYADEYAQLLCPCHHSVFDARTGAQPIGGPAARPLPQLPLRLDDEGYLSAVADFTAPTGAGWWGYPV
jgi:ubiquinol-cytochrome c reductase iron-sulfur subunit